jgi:hypothetical protein
MKRVTKSWTLAEIGYFREVLESNGIPCLIKNEQLTGALGEVPFLECLPELWVLRDSDLHAANRLIAELEKPVVGGSRWRCRYCNEDNEAEFGVCWNCGRPDGDDEPTS